MKRFTTANGTAGSFRGGVRAGLAVVVAVLVTACSNLPIEDWSEVRGPKEPLPKLVTYHHRVAFPRGSARLSAEQRRGLLEFLAAAGGGRRSRAVALDAFRSPAGGADRLAEQRVRALAGAVESSGHRMGEVRWRNDLARGGDTVMVTVQRYTVVLPRCPDWSDPPARNYNNQPYRNFGCATAINFGLMVADPEDLIHGRPLAPGDGERLARSIEKYRKGEEKSIDAEQTSEDFTATQ